MAHLGSYAGDATVEGVSIDVDGKVWGVGSQGFGGLGLGNRSTAWRLDPATSTVDTHTGLNGAYSYSDMTHAAAGEGSSLAFVSTGERAEPWDFTGDEVYVSLFLSNNICSTLALVPLSEPYLLMAGFPCVVHNSMVIRPTDGTVVYKSHGPGGRLFEFTPDVYAVTGRGRSPPRGARRATTWSSRPVATTWSPSGCIRSRATCSTRART